MEGQRDDRLRIRYFVGNAPYRARMEDFKAFFASIGEILELKLEIDRESGRRKGFCFVELRLWPGIGADAWGLVDQNPMPDPYDPGVLRVVTVRPAERRRSIWDPSNPDAPPEPDPSKTPEG